MKKVYLSGKISGLPPQVAEKNFRQSKLEVIELYMPQEIVNPMYLKPFLGIKCWLCYMITDLIALRSCDAIYMLNNWENSKGAFIEHLIARHFWHKQIEKQKP